MSKTLTPYWTSNQGWKHPGPAPQLATWVIPRAEIPTQLPRHLPNATPEEKTVTNDIDQEHDPNGSDPGHYDPQESIHPGMRARHALDEVLEDTAFLPGGENADFPEDDEVHRLAPSPGPLLAGVIRQRDPEACIHMRHQPGGPLR